MWLMLTPREVELLTCRVYSADANSAIVVVVQSKIDRITGELTLTDDELQLIRDGARNWRGGYEKQLKALLAAADRHTTSGRA